MYSSVSHHHQQQQGDTRIHWSTLLIVRSRGQRRKGQSRLFHAWAEERPGRMRHGRRGCALNMDGHQSRPPHHKPLRFFDAFQKITSTSTITSRETIFGFDFASKFSSPRRPTLEDDCDIASRGIRKNGISSKLRGRSVGAEHVCRSGGMVLVMVPNDATVGRPGNHAGKPGRRCRGAERSPDGRIIGYHHQDHPTAPTDVLRADGATAQL